MSRKHCRRRVTVPLPPPGLRQPLTADQVRDLGLVHSINLDAIARGDADEATLWQWVGGILTWSHAADLRQAGVPEMVQQLELTHRVVERYRRTGKVRFSGPDYQLAKHGVLVMDELAATTDRCTATAAANWSEAMLNGMVASVRASTATGGMEA